MKTLGIKEILLLLFLFSLVVPAVTGKTLIGNNYGNIMYTYTDFGTNPQKTAFGQGDTVTGQVNLALKNSVDFRFGLDYSYASGLYASQSAKRNIWTADFDFLLPFSQGDVITPYAVLGLAILYQDVDLVGHGIQETDLGFNLGVGGEFELGSQFLARTELDWLAVDMYSEVLISGLLGYWFAEGILGHISAGYEFDDQDVLGSLGVAFTF